MIDNILAIRDRAQLRGDVSLVAECDAQLARLGHHDVLSAGFIEVAVTDENEHAVPVRGVPAKRGPGRPRKAR